MIKNVISTQNLSDLFLISLFNSTISLGIIYVLLYYWSGNEQLSEDHIVLSVVLFPVIFFCSLFITNTGLLLYYYPFIKMIKKRYLFIAQVLLMLGLLFALDLIFCTFIDPMLSDNYIHAFAQGIEQEGGKAKEIESIKESTIFSSTFITNIFGILGGLLLSVWLSFRIKKSTLHE